MIIVLEIILCMICLVGGVGMICFGLSIAFGRHRDGLGDMCIGVLLSLVGAALLALPAAAILEVKDLSGPCAHKPHFGACKELVTHYRYDPSLKLAGITVAVGRNDHAS